MKAEVSHIPQIARQWYQLKQETAFAQLDIEWSVPLCATYLQEVLDKENSYLAVEIHHGKVVAACGVTLLHTLTPPHIPTVTEWLWTGNGRSAVKVLHECHSWGKAHGAQLAQYVFKRVGRHKKKFTELSQWRVL